MTLDELVESWQQSVNDLGNGMHHKEREGLTIAVEELGDWLRHHVAAVTVAPDALTAANALADEIRARRTGLDNEDRQAEGIELRHYARAKKHRDQDRARVNGMVIALSYILGEPLHMQKAEEFITARKNECAQGNIREQEK